MLRCDSAPRVQPGSGSCLAWHRVRGSSHRFRFAALCRSSTRHRPPAPFREL